MDKILTIYLVDARSVKSTIIVEVDNDFHYSGIRNLVDELGYSDSKIKDFKFSQAKIYNKRTK